MTVGLGLGGRLAGSGSLGLSGYTYILFFTDGGEKTSLIGSFGKELGIVTVSNMSSCERGWRFRHGYNRLQQITSSSTNSIGNVANSKRHQRLDEI